MANANMLQIIFFSLIVGIALLLLDKKTENFRRFLQEWDYQRLRFPRNEGMRIDFVYGSAALAARVTGAAIDRDERKGKGASDHVPVIVDLA